MLICIYYYVVLNIFINDQFLVLECLKFNSHRSKSSYNDDILKNKYNNNQEKAKGDPDRKLIEGWLDNYILDIKKKNKEYDYVFTASFSELIDRLLAEDLQLAIVMPENNDEV